MSTFYRNVHPYNERGQAGYLDPLGIYRRGQRAAGAVRRARDLLRFPVQTLIPSVPSYIVNKLQDPNYTQSIVQRKPFTTDYFENERETYFANNNERIMDQRHALYAAGIMQENDVLEGVNKQQRLILAQHHLDEHTNNRLVIRDDLTYQPAEGETGQIMMVVENRATGAKTIVHPGSRLNASTQALADWAGNLGELSRGFLPVGADTVVDRTLRRITGSEIAKKSAFLREKGLFDPESPNFVTDQVGASKGADTAIKLMSEHVKDLNPEAKAQFMSEFNKNTLYNPMSTPSNVVEMHRNGALYDIIRADNDIATMAQMPAAVVDGLHKAITGRDARITVRTRLDARGNFIDRHLNFPEKQFLFKARLNEYGTRRLLYELQHSAAMRKAINEGKSFTEYAEENDLLNADGNLNPRKAAWHVQTWEEISDALRESNDYVPSRAQMRDLQIEILKRDMQQLEIEKGTISMSEAVNELEDSVKNGTRDAEGFLNENDYWRDAWNSRNETSIAAKEARIAQLTGRRYEPSDQSEVFSGGEGDIEMVRLLQPMEGEETKDSEPVVEQESKVSLERREPESKVFSGEEGGIEMVETKTSSQLLQELLARPTQDEVRAMRRAQISRGERGIEMGPVRNQEMQSMESNSSGRRPFPEGRFASVNNMLEPEDGVPSEETKNFEPVSERESKVSSGEPEARPRINTGGNFEEIDESEISRRRYSTEDIGENFENFYNETFKNELAGIGAAQEQARNMLNSTETNPLLQNVHDQNQLSQNFTAEENNRFAQYTEQMYGDVRTLNADSEIRNFSANAMEGNNSILYGIRTEEARNRFNRLSLQEQEQNIRTLATKANELTTMANEAQRNATAEPTMGETILEAAQPSNVIMGTFTGFLGKETAEFLNFLSGHKLGDKSKGDDMFWENVLAGGLTAPYAKTGGMFMSDSEEALGLFRRGIGSEASLAGFGRLGSTLFADAPAFAAGTALGIAAGDLAEKSIEKSFINANMNPVEANYFANALGVGGVGGFVGGFSTSAIGSALSAGVSAALGSAVTATAAEAFGAALGGGVVGAAIGLPLVAALGGMKAVSDIKDQANLTLGSLASQQGRKQRLKRLQMEQRMVRMGLQTDISDYNEAMKENLSRLNTSRANILADYTDGKTLFHYNVGHQRRTQGGPLTLDGTHGHGWFAKQSEKDQQSILKDIFNQRMNQFEGLFNDQSNLDPGKFNSDRRYAPLDVSIWMQGNPEKYQQYLDFNVLKALKGKKDYDVFVQRIKSQGREIPTSDGLTDAERAQVELLGEANLRRMVDQQTGQLRKDDHFHVDGFDIDTADGKNVKWIEHGQNLTNRSEPEKNRTAYNPTDSAQQRQNEKDATAFFGAGGIQHRRDAQGRDDDMRMFGPAQSPVVAFPDGPSNSLRN